MLTATSPVPVEMPRMMMSLRPERLRIEPEASSHARKQGMKSDSFAPPVMVWSRSAVPLVPRW